MCIYVTSSRSSIVSTNYQYNLFVKKIEELKIQEYRDNLIQALIWKESSNRNVIVGDMVGILQIRPIMVREVNNILGYTKYFLKDRLNKIKSIEMFTIYTNHHTPNWDLELVCRRWNGGYRGEYKLETFKYYQQIKTIMKC